MICELFPFQKQAVNEMRLRVAMALNNYRMLKIPQVVSLQAPTGSGKTIIMSALIEDIFYGSEQFTEQPEAIFVWLSDSPQLNEQSKQKIELKADKVRMDQCVVISDESFDREILEDGHIYFLNTQKLGKAGNLSRHSDTRQYTIWETIENTAREKADRLYFIIDEAHRGMQGRQAGTATTIMQRFIKGSNEQNLSPIPVVIGMSATAERFNSLVGQGTNSTLHKVVISPAQVRQSGLLKDRIVITYPEDPIKHGDMAVLQAATDEWQDKCKHWYQYTYEQHYPNVNPVFVIQVCAGSDKKISDTDLDDVIAKIEERMGDTFKENEVVHTFGSTGTLSIHGLTVPHVEPSEIAEDRRIRVVLFKENLSTGWDCPRAETMMSFRRAEDATYIAQLLGRMVRTPLQCHVLVDDSLNDVRLFLPYFNQDTVQKVIDELQATEGGEIPTVVDGESLEDQTYDTWSVHTQRKKTQKQTVGQLSIFDYPNGFQEEPAAAPSTAIGDMSNSGAVAANQGGADSEIPAEGQHQTIPLETVSGNDVHAGQETERTSGGNQSVNKEQPVLTPAVSQMSMLPTIDREGITKFINEQGYLTYIVRAVKINSYLKSLMSLAGLLSQFNICITAAEDVKNDVAELIRNYVNGLHDAGKYDELTKQVMEMKLSAQIFDVFGEKIQSDNRIDMFTASESDLDRQLRVADAKMGGCGFHLAYGRKYIDFDNPNAFKVDCILFAFDSECIAELNKYAEKKFHELNDQYVAIGADHARHTRTEELPKATLRSIKPFLPPELIIQDELHLITGPLGTVYGAYETVIEDLCSYTIGGKKIKPKYVVSTATIKNAAEQTKCLYGRKVTAQFPPNGFEIGDSFYIREVPVEQDPFRRYVGVCAPGQSVKTALLRVYSIILQSAYNLSLDDEYKDVIDPYYTLVGYYNSIRELGGAVRLLQDDIPDRIQRIKKKYGMSRQRFLNHKVEITSRMPSYDIPKKLSQLETPYTDSNCPDTAIATNMIAVGMDVDRLGLMVVTGQPKQNSEYIQATSRIGRSYPGLVVTLYNPYRPRDLSHYENFTGYHAQLYRFVEGTTATPFSARARDRVLHALVISAIRLHYPEFASNDGAAAIDKLTDEQLNEVKALIMNRLNIIKPSAKADAEHEIDDFISNWKLLATQSKGLRYYVYTTKTYNRLMNTYGEVCTDLEKPTLCSMRDVESAANMFYYTED